MGCDIHLFVEHRVKGRWQLVEPPEKPGDDESSYRWGPGMRNGSCYECDNVTGTAGAWLIEAAHLLNTAGNWDLVDMQYQVLSRTPEGDALRPVFMDALEAKGATPQERRALRVIALEQWHRSLTGCARCMYTGRDLRWWGDRNYVVFYTLTGTVRQTGNAPTITREPRGLPTNACAYLKKYGQELMDHSRSWLAVDELLAHSWGGDANTHRRHPVLA